MAQPLASEAKREPGRHVCARLCGFVSHRHDCRDARYDVAQRRVRWYDAVQNTATLRDMIKLSTAGSHRFKGHMLKLRVSKPLEVLGYDLKLRDPGSRPTHPDPSFGSGHDVFLQVLEQTKANVARNLEASPSFYCPCAQHESRCLTVALYHSDSTTIVGMRSGGITEDQSCSIWCRIISYVIASCCMLLHFLLS